MLILAIITKLHVRLNEVSGPFKIISFISDVEMRLLRDDNEEQTIKQNKEPAYEACRNASTYTHSFKGIQLWSLIQIFSVALGNET